MRHGEANAALLAAVDAKIKDAILANIANHYGIKPEQAMSEVTGEAAVSILDYVTGPMRAAVSMLRRQHGIPDPGPIPSGERWGDCA